MPINEIIGFGIGALIIGGLLWLMCRPQSSSYRRRFDPLLFGGPLQSTLRAYREDQLSGDKGLRRYNQARTRNAVFLLAVIILLIVFALLAEFWWVEDIARPARPASWP